MKIRNFKISKKMLLGVCVAIIIVAILIAKSNKPIHRDVVDSSNEIAGRIAIIVDDWGYNSRGCDFFEKLQSPISISVLPKLSFSSQIAKCAHENNKEVMLHLPLEPHKFLEKYPDHYVALTSMNRDRKSVV